MSLVVHPPSAIHPFDFSLSVPLALLLFQYLARHKWKTTPISTPPAWLPAFKPDCWRQSSVPLEPLCWTSLQPQIVPFSIWRSHNKRLSYVKKLTALATMLASIKRSSWFSFFSLVWSLPLSHFDLWLFFNPQLLHSLSYVSIQCY